MQKRYSDICAGCIHWQPLHREIQLGYEAGAQEIGECRRHPPMFTHGPGRVFPVTGYNDWCSIGQEQKPATDNARPWWQFWRRTHE